MEELLRNYLTTRAGRVILMFDPGVPTGLENLLFDWGVIVYDNVIYDPDPRSITKTMTCACGASAAIPPATSPTI